MLPIDQLVGRSNGDWNEDYVESQASLMKRAHEVVSSRLRAAAEKEEHRYGRNTSATTLEVGDRVLLKRHAFTERHKLQDKFYDTPYVVVDVNNHNDLYQIRPASGGELKWVNRRQLVVDPRGVVEEEPDVRDRSPESEDHVTSSSSDDEFESDDDDLGIVRLQLQQDECEREEELQPRRSSRSTRGVHRNPAHLPTSVNS